MRDAARRAVTFARAHARDLGVCALAGLCGAAAFPLVIEALSPEPLLDAAPREALILAPAVALYRLRDLPARRAAAYAFVAGLGFFALLIGWVKHAMTTFGGMPEWQAAPVLALLVAWCAAFWAMVPGITRFVVTRARLPAPVAFAAAVVATEWLRGVALTGFPWGLWGYSMARHGPLLALAGWTGVYGVSALIAVAGGLLVDVRSRRWRALAPLLLVVLGAHAFGVARLRRIEPSDAPPIRVGVVQGNLTPRLRVEGVDRVQAVRKRYIDLSQSIAKSVDLVVWPEAAWPTRASTDTARLFFEELGVPLLTGVSTLEPGPHERRFNSAFWIDRHGAVTGRYDKRHLVPFGEYVPLRSLLPVERFAPRMRDYSAGEHAALLGDPPVGTLICYDGVFPELARDAVHSGAQVLVNITNDAWYGVSGAPYQHRDFYAFRAVETDRWIVRAANTGISAFIGPDGVISGATAIDETTVTVAAVQPRAGFTFYATHGDWLVALAFGAMLAALLDLVWGALPRRARSIDTAQTGGQ